MQVEREGEKRKEKRKEGKDTQGSSEKMELCVSYSSLHPYCLLGDFILHPPPRLLSCLYTALLSIRILVSHANSANCVIRLTGQIGLGFDLLLIPEALDKSLQSHTCTLLVRPS